MPFPTSISAELLPAGPRVTNGDVEQFAFSRITRLRGTTGTTLANAPPLTLTGNLLTVAAPVRNWSMVPFAGLGLSLEVAYAGGNFPEVAIRQVQQFQTASTSHVYNYPLLRVVNQLLVVVIATAALTTITTPSGWTLVSSQAGTESRSSVFFRILTGAEGDSETITFGTASGAIMRTWCINLADGDVETTDALNDSAAGTSLDIGSIAPTWSINEETNTLYIAVCATADDVAFSAFPSAYTPVGQDANASGTANIDCALAYAERRALGSSEDPSGFTYAASRSTGHIIAIQPKPAGRINWDGLEVRDNATPVGTQRALNLIEGTGITLAFNNNVGTGAVDVTINATGGGGAGWDDVLANDNHSGANNPFVDTGQFLSFGTGTPTQTTGDIRADSDLFIHPDVGFELQAHDTIYIHGPDTILLESTGGSPVRLLSSTTVELESTAGPVELNANTFVDVTNGFIRMQEQTASTPVLGAGKGLFWVRDDVPCIPMFTDDTNVDFKLLKEFALIGDLQNIAQNRILGRVTAGSGDIEELTGTQATTILDVFTSALKGLAPASGGGTANFLRADGTWAVPPGTNPGHLIRVDDLAQTQRAALNFIDTGSIIVTPTDDSVNNETELRFNFAAITANSLLANATAGSAGPSALAIAAESVVGRTSGNLQAITSSAQSILMRAAGSVFWGTAAADQVLRRSGSGDLGFGTLVTANLGDASVTLPKIQDINTARVLGRVTAGTGDVEELTGAQMTTLVDRTANFAWTGNHTHSQTATFSVSSVADVQLSATDGLGLFAGFANADIATGDMMLNATSGIGIFAGFASAEVAMSADDISIGSDSGVAITAGVTPITNVAAGILLSTATTITMITNAVTRLLIDSDGSWAVNGATGTLNQQALISGGVSASPTWGAVTNAVLDDMAQATIKGRARGAGTGDPTDLTGTQACSILRWNAQESVNAAGHTSNVAIDEATTSFRFTNGGATAIVRSIVAPATEGQLTTLEMSTTGGDEAIFLHRDTAETSANQIDTPGSIPFRLSANSAYMLVYASQKNRWTILGPPGGDHASVVDIDDHFDLATDTLNSFEGTTPGAFIFTGTNRSWSIVATPNAGSAGSVGNVDNELHHRGILYLETPSSQNDGIAMFMGRDVVTASGLSATEAMYDSDQIYRWECWIKIPSGQTTNFIILAGFMADPTDNNGGAEFIGFHANTAGGVSTTNWVARCRAASTNTDLDTAVAFSNAVWHKLEFFRFDEYVIFYVNRVFIGTMTTNVPNGNGTIGVRLVTTASTSPVRLVHIDRIILSIREAAMD